MLFKQFQVFQLHDFHSSSIDDFIGQLEPLQITPCLPSISSTMGWCAPIDEENVLAKELYGNIIFCMQTEEKILPASVIRQNVMEKIKHIEQTEARKVRQKEKLSLKDEVTFSLLPKAFSKFTKVYAYIDIKNQWLILGTTNAKQTESFLSMFKKSLGENVDKFELKKLSPIMSSWLKNKNYPDSLEVEKSCVLQDPEQQSRVVRCQQQDLFANSIQLLLKDGCAVKQIALTWQDHLSFVLTDEFYIRSIKFHDDLLAQAKELEVETEIQQFVTDFLIMTKTFSELLKDLLVLFKAAKEEVIEVEEESLV